MVPDLPSYRWVLVSSSAGKDSQAMLDYVVELCDRAHVPRRRLVVAHADLGRVEWPGTRQLAEEQARHYGLAFHAVSRRQGDLLDHIAKRGMFPSPTSRFCTSDHKRTQIWTLFTRLVEEAQAEGSPSPVRILSCMGLRAQESPARARRQPFSHEERASNGRRHVDLWLPIQGWTVQQVWDRIRASGVHHHPAYDLACRGCPAASASSPCAPPCSWRANTILSYLLSTPRSNVASAIAFAWNCRWPTSRRGWLAASSLTLSPTG